MIVFQNLGIILQILSSLKKNLKVQILSERIGNYIFYKDLQKAKNSNQNLNPYQFTRQCK